MIFDCPDGTLIEVKSDKARRFRSDCCQCVLVIEVDTYELDFPIEVCEIHKSIRESDLMTNVLVHLRSFNYLFGNVNLTKEQNVTIDVNKKNESERILGLGTVEIRADKTTKAVIESDLRTKGR